MQARSAIRKWKQKMTCEIKMDQEVKRNYRTKRRHLHKKEKPGQAGGILCLLICLFCMLATPALAQTPEPNGYVADNPLVEYSHDTLKGDLYYSIGSSYYSGKVYPGNVYTVSHSVNLPEGAGVKFARLYAYWTWSAEIITGRDPDMKLSFNEVELEPESKYSDRKGWGIYDYPTGTWAYDVTDYVSGSGTFNTGIENTGPAASYFCMDGVGLLIVYTDPDGKDIEYWISEGADELNSQMDENGNPLYYATPNQTICEMLKPTIQLPVNKATLWSVIQSGNWADNILLVNDMEIPGICNAKPYADLDLDTRDITDCLIPGENVIRFQAVGDYVVPSNSFLIIETIPGVASSDTEFEAEAPPEEKDVSGKAKDAAQPSGTSKTPGFGFGFSLAILSGGKLAAGIQSKRLSIKSESSLKKP